MFAYSGLYIGFCGNALFMRLVVQRRQNLNKGLVRPVDTMYVICVPW